MRTVVAKQDKNGQNKTQVKYDTRNKFYLPTKALQPLLVNEIPQCSKQQLGQRCHLLGSFVESGYKM